MNMNKPKWKKGWPPFKGWWNMSICRDSGIWRWIEPETGFISVAVYKNLDASDAARKAKVHDIFRPIEELEYSDYWPENARVPRIDPRKK